MTTQKRCFILGMIVAFSECVAGGCKKLALSPPLEPGEYEEIGGEMRQIIEKHGLIHLHEKNAELDEGERWEWVLIAARQRTLDAYMALRARGYSPAKSLEPFYGLLSYNESEGVRTGYDAFRAYFPREPRT